MRRNALRWQKKFFDQMAPFVHFCIVRDALGPVGLGGNDRASGLWPDFESPFCAGAMLVDPDECAVDEDIFEIGIVAERLENVLPNALLRPPPEASTRRKPLAERFRQIAPRQ
jgi:hypothetical protein